MYRWRDDAFNSVLRSAAFHTIHADTTALDCSTVDSKGIGADGNDGNNTITGIDTVGDKQFAPKTVLSAVRAVTQTAVSVSARTVGEG